LPPQVHLEDVQVGNLSVARARGEVVSVPHGSVVKLRLAVLGFDSRSWPRVEHQLEGSDRSWVGSGNSRVAEYSGLRPGSYRFRVRVRDDEGRWHDAPWLQDIKVRPRFWSTPGFLVSCTIAAAGIGSGIYYRRRSREAKRAAAIRLRTLQSERSRIARDMHDHLGGKLAGLALRAGNTPHVQESVREILSELNDLVWSVDPRNDTLSGLADFIADAAAQYLAAANLRLELSMPESLPERLVQGAVRHELLAVYREALRNIVEHANASLVKVQFSASPDFIEIVVEDDGTGFDAEWTDSAKDEESSATAPVSAREGGLERFRMRMRSVGGRCRIKSAAGVGTRLEFRVPLAGSGS